MVLVFSASSNSSEDVSRELFLAANSKLIIIPFKIENVEPEPGKQYYLARTHWLDAINPPTQEQINALLNCVNALILVKESPPVPEVEPTTAPHIDQTIPGNEPLQSPLPRLTPKKRPAWLRYLWISASFVILVLIGWVILTFVRQSFPALMLAPAQATETATPSPTAFGGGTSWIAFSDEINGNRDVYIIKSDGSNKTRLTTNEGQDWNPVWSPDGKKIAFLSMRDGNSEIYIMNVDGSNVRRLTNNKSYEGYPSWSPDGQNLVFTTDRDEPDLVGCVNSAAGCNSNIYVINITSLHETRLTDSPADNEGSTWSPDGKQILFYSTRDGMGQIYVMQVDGSNVTRLTNDQAQDWRPAWSPDGKQIAFMSYTDGKSQIYVMNADGSNVTRLTNDQADDQAPDWSPDGRHIAFYSSTGGGIFRICMMDFNGTNLSCLTDDLINPWEPKWQPFTTALIVVPTNQTASSTSGPNLVTEQPFPERVEELLGQMTLDEKIGQMTQVEKNSIKPGDITRYFIGSILSGGGGFPSNNTVEGWAAMVDGFQKEALATRLKIPIIYGVDAVHGHGNLYGATIFPQEVGLGATRDVALVRQIGQATADEMLATGIQWDFAPVIAVPQDIRWGRTYEAYGEDTSLVSELGSAYIQGMQSLPEGYQPAAGQTLYALATAKHYLGDGGTTFGSSTQNIIKPYLLDQGDMRYDEADIRTLFLPPYQDAVDSGAMSVMASFSSWNGVKMHAQKVWLTDGLKGELGFQGFIVSDWAGMDQISGNYYTAIVTGINAGIDMNMVPYDYVRFIDTMKQAVSNGDIAEERIDDAVRRILTVKFELGLFDHPYSDSALPLTVGSDAHRTLARQAVRESLVLLKNDNAALPLAKDTSTIYVAGQGADDIGMQCGGWTIEWQGKTGAIDPGTTILQGIKAEVSTGTQVEYNSGGTFTGMAEVGIAVVGEQPYAEGVGDTNSLNLSQTDIQTITNLRSHSQKLVVIILSGRPLVITGQFQKADAWVAAWLPGTEGAGVADVLFGDFPFVGKLPYTWPRSNSQLPINKNNSTDLTGCAAPLFPYGYGLEQAGSQPIAWLDCP
jgi:beta-glucosidase